MKSLLKSLLLATVVAGSMNFAIAAMDADDKMLVVSQAHGMKSVMSSEQGEFEMILAKSGAKQKVKFTNPFGGFDAFLSAIEANADVNVSIAGAGAADKKIQTIFLPNAVAEILKLAKGANTAGTALNTLDLATISADANGEANALATNFDETLVAVDALVYTPKLATKPVNAKITEVLLKKKKGTIDLTNTMASQSDLDDMNTAVADEVKKYDTYVLSVVEGSTVEDKLLDAYFNKGTPKGDAAKLLGGSGLPADLDGGFRLLMKRAGFAKVQKVEDLSEAGKLDGKSLKELNNALLGFATKLEAYDRVNKELLELKAKASGKPIEAPETNAGKPVDVAVRYKTKDAIEKYITSSTDKDLYEAKNFGDVLVPNWGPLKKK